MGLTQLPQIDQIPVQSSAPLNPAVNDLWVDSDEVGGEAAGVWELVFNIVGTEAMTNWTTMSGVWAPNASGYWEITTAGSPGILRYTPRVFTAAMILEAEVFNPSGGTGTTRLGIAQHNETDYVYQPGVYAGNAGEFNTAGALVPITTVPDNNYGNAPGLALDTWTKLRGVFIGPKVTAYVDGVCRGSAYAGADNRAAHSFCLWSQNGKARYRNIKLWTLTGNLPL